VTGHRGLVGSALVRRLRAYGFENIITWRRDEVDLKDPVVTKWAFSVHEPEYVFHCAARVGGIQDNRDHPTDFLVENLRIQENVLLNAADYRVKKLVFLGSSCVYPYDAKQPIQESSLLTGPFTPDVEAYGLAKVAGIRLCQYLRKERGCNFVSAMPCNIFGPNDNFDPVTAHVVPGMMARMHCAKLLKEPTFKVWGSRSVRREHIFSDDLADALILVMEKYEDMEPINTGSGFELDMQTLSNAIAAVMNYQGELCFDTDRPSGVYRKVLDNSKLSAMGYERATSFTKALAITYNAFRECYPTNRR
jgi:GDP-L-fucose synthase